MHPKSGKTKHSFVQFYPTDWLGGTARMTRLIKSVYFDVCLYNWDKVEAVPEAELMLMLDDLGPQGEQIINVLVASGRLIRNSEGSVYSERAMLEAQRAYDLWLRKSKGGKKGAAKTNDGENDDGTPAGSRVETPVAEPEPEPEPESKKGADAPLSDGDGEKPDEGEEGEKPVRKTYDTLKVMEAWNTMAAANGLPQIIKMTEERRKKTRARLDDYSEAQILEAIGLVPERPFCMGQNDRRWKADYDWFVRPGTVAKLIEGGAYTGGGKGSGWLDG